MSGRRRIWVEGCVGGVALVVFALLASAVTSGGWVVSLDDDVSRRMVGILSAGTEWAARLATYLGGVAGTALVTLVALIVLWRARRLLDAVFVVACVAGITVILTVLKNVFERERPQFGSAIPLPHSYSFPSGHAGTAIVLYGALGLLLAERAASRRRAAAWLALAVALVLAIGASRVLLNVHFVSDVLAGYAIGLAWLCACLVGRDLVRSRRGEAAGAG